MYFDIVLRYQLLGKISCPLDCYYGPLPPSSLPLITQASLLRSQLPEVELNAQISRTDDEYNLPPHEDQLQEH